MYLATFKKHVNSIKIEDLTLNIYENRPKKQKRDSRIYLATFKKHVNSVKIEDRTRLCIRNRSQNHSKHTCFHANAANGPENIHK